MPFGQTGTPTFFYQPSVRPPWGFRLASVLYGWGIWLHQVLYACRVLPVHRLPVPVISVGNLTAGGTGKTPVTLSLAQWLESQGLRVVVLSRGYGAPVKTLCHLADSPQYGDEPYTLQQGLVQGKVLVGPRRVETGKYAIANFSPQVIVLDDGFQHRPLHRDFEIVLVDGTLGVGNAQLLPAGPLREPLCALARADVVMLTKTPTAEIEAQMAKSLQKAQGHARLWHVPFEITGLLNPHTQGQEPLASLGGQAVVLVSALANPQGFETMVQRELGAKVQSHAVFPDHWNYTAADLQAVEEALYANPAWLLVTTTKDWVKLADVFSQFLRPRVRVVTVAPQVDWGAILQPKIREWGLV